MNNNNSNGTRKSSTGLDENVAGLLCYLAAWVTGLIFYFVEKESRFVKFHALQSTITFLGLNAVTWIVGKLPVLWILTWPLNVLNFILWIILMVKAYNKEWFKLPIVGDIVEKQMNKQ